MGISMSAVIQLSGIVLTWMNTKGGPFGTLVARRDIAGLDRLFFRTLWQSLALLAWVEQCCCLRLSSRSLISPVGLGIALSHGLCSCCSC